jgi:hypothetical protein
LVGVVGRLSCRRRPDVATAGGAGGSPEWSRETAADLRHFLVQQIELQIDRRLLTVPVLEAE